MTEAEWLACDDPVPMLEFLQGAATDRKLWLFGCACCRRIEALLLPVSREAVDVSERYADGQVSHAELTDASIRNHRGAGASANEVAIQAAVAVNLAVVDPARNGFPSLPVARAAGLLTTKVVQTLRAAAGSGAEGEAAAQAGLFRCVMGNPFRPVAFSPVWRTPVVARLAQQMYDSRDFSHLALLADALQDAGCDSADVLDHCRGPGPHARGCWVVDLILGKQ